MDNNLNLYIMKTVSTLQINSTYSLQVEHVEFKGLNWDYPIKPNNTLTPEEEILVRDFLNVFYWED